MIVFTIYKNGGNAGDLGASFSCVEMSANRGKKYNLFFLCGIHHLVVQRKIIRKVNDNDDGRAVMSAVVQALMLGAQLFGRY